jgi:tRNA G10  N-methylase Trm11
MQTKLINDGKKKPIEIINVLKKTPWKKGAYAKQNWGNWLHHMSPFVGKMKPAIASILVDISSNEKETVLDPFCGVGTVPLEADLSGRIPIGVDLNPYAFAITRAKFDRRPIKELISWLNEVKLDVDSIKLDNVSDFVKQFYHEKTLKEIISLRDHILRDKQYFLLGCLLGILHGHRPGHLSAVTSLVIPYSPKTKPHYKEVIPRMIDKVNRMYRNEFPLKTDGRIMHGDARKLPLSKNEVDVIISSPPYYNTLDYIQDNRLRLEILGFDEDKRGELKKNLIQNKSTYLEEMSKVGVELKRVLKPQSLCIFILGDSQIGKKVINTAQEVGNVYEGLGFSIIGMTEDWMPKNKAIPSSFKREKLDRFLLLLNNK